MSLVSATAAPEGDHRHLAERLAARALRLALDPCAPAPDGATELALLAGDSPRQLAKARRRLRCGDKTASSGIVARAQQLLSAAQLSAELPKPPPPPRPPERPEPLGGVVTSIWTTPRRRGEA